MKQLISIERVENKILEFRGQKVMVDRDLAELYGVRTAELARVVNRNPDRFPNDFMFVLNDEEWRELRYQFGTAIWGMVRHPPRAFTEQGVEMLSSVLRSPRAAQVNIAIMRAFVKMREMMVGYKDLAGKIAELEQKFEKHDGQIKLVFDALRGLMEPPKTAKKKFGFRKSRDENGGTVTKARKK